jgi:cytochrome c
MNFILLLAQVPVPKDIPLPLPVPEWLLIFLLVFSFGLHIIFVNLMVGGTLLTFFAQIKGLREPDYDTLAHEIAKTITVNKSLAVVLGVAPLLTINTLYTIYFYTANSLTGLFWIAIIPLVTVAFLLTYPHKYLWETLKDNKGLHISMIGAASGIFLFIPLIFLTNINLMLFPEKWGSIKGFASALFLPNVFPRYFHFIFASLAATGLFLFYFFGRQSYPFSEKFKTISRHDVLKRMLSLSFMATLLQFVAGPLVLLTLPTKGMNWRLILIILPGVLLALPALYWMWKGITSPENLIGKDFKKIVTALSLTVVFMISGRQVYRMNALEPHQKLVQQRTAEYEKAIEEARMNLAKENSGKKEDTSDSGKIARGEQVFTQYCSACHNLKIKVVGPPVTEMKKIYGNDLEGIKKWIKAPGKKRPDYPQMPAFPQLEDSELDSLVTYIMSIK